VIGAEAPANHVTSTVDRQPNPATDLCALASDTPVRADKWRWGTRLSVVFGGNGSRGSFPVTVTGPPLVTTG
jgi:hypothetical protein